MGPPWIFIRTFMDLMWGPSGPSMAPYQDPTWIKCVHSWSKMSIFHLKYVQMCPGYKLFQNVNIFIWNICVNVFTVDPKCKYLIWNMCKCVWVPHGSLYGSYMDPYMDRIWIPMWILYGSSICKCVHSWSKMLIFHLKYVQMCQEEYGGAAWIPLRIRHRSLYGSYMDPYVDLILVVYM